MMPTCSFCGSEGTNALCPPYRSRLNHSIAICRHCARKIIRAFGEVPDAGDGVIDLASRRPALAVVD